jgi:hypothetical protein
MSFIKQSSIQQLKELNLKTNPDVTLTYSMGTDVFVHNETAIETAINETDVIDEFCSVLAALGDTAKCNFGGSSIMGGLRKEGFLDGYARDYTFEEYLYNVIEENFWDQEHIESTVEQYDHKRGFCTLEVNLKVPLQELIERQPSIHGWKVSVPLSTGTLILD